MYPDIPLYLHNDLEVIIVWKGKVWRRFSMSFQRSFADRRRTCAFSKGRYATDEDLAAADAILQAVGITASTDEDLLDAVTALSGSGDAYAFLIAEAMIKAGGRLGRVKGCPLSCLWCHNPEGISPRPELVFRQSRCNLCGDCLSTGYFNLPKVLELTLHDGVDPQTGKRIGIATRPEQDPPGRDHRSHRT